MSQLYTRDSIERLRSAIDMLELVNTRTELRRVGSQWMGLCPFHDDRRPSLSVNAQTKLFHCFGCEAQGDAFGFVMQSEGVPFREAAELLADRFRVPLDLDGEALRQREPRPSRARTHSALPTSGQADDARRATVRAENVLGTTKRADNAGRATGNAPRTTERAKNARRALDGYVEHCHRRLMTREGYPARRWLYARGLGDGDLIAHRIGYDPGYRALGRRRRAPPAVTLPLLDDAGDVVYAQGRLLDPPPDAPKFLNPPGDWIGPSPRVSAVRSPPTADRDVLVLCEGLCDGMLAGRYYETRALIGAKQPDEAVIDRLATAAGERPVAVCFDADATGRLWATKAVDRLAERGVRSASVALPAEDVTDLRLDAGERFEQVFRGLVQTAVERADARELDPLREHGHLLGLRRLELMETALRDGVPGQLSTALERLNPDDALEFLRIERRRAAVTTLIESDQREAAELTELARAATGTSRSRYDELARSAFAFVAEDRSELAQLERAARGMRLEGRDLDTWLNANLADVRRSVATVRDGAAPRRDPYRAPSLNVPGYDVGPGMA